MSWARLTDRRAAGIALGAAFGLLIVGGALAPTSAASRPAHRDVAAATPATATDDASPSPSPTPSAPTRTPTPAPTAASPRPPAPGTALALLGTLAVNGRAPKTGYSRDEFGQAWADTDRNGCDTRNDVLRRDLTAVVLKPGTNGCLVLSGTLADPYTATRIQFVRGGAGEVDIDHVVSLSDAWQTGATSWTARKRLALANDPLNLLAVDAGANRQKSDSDAASWLPPNRSYRCSFVARQVAVKAKFRLWVTRAERDAIARVLSSCPDTPAPSGGNPTIAPFSAPVTRRTTSAPAPVATTATTSATGANDPQFGTCKAAIAAGYGPYVQGRDPEYDWYRDADHDGVVCER